jgi:RHS repeat-associated protein
VRRVAEVTAMRPDGGTNNAAVTARHKGALFIPPPVEVVTHDDDGNQTSNAHWSYTWDGENRLVVAEESLAILLQPPGSGPVKRQRVECAYDAQGRRIYKRVLTAEGMSTTFILKQSVVFLYDGWNMIAEIDTTTSARLIRSYEWGLDISGTFDGAGGVGGLLVLRTHPSTINTQPSTGAYAPTYDGNGNVMELVNLANGSVSARYEYGAFGETISVDGESVADANPIRFSTKYLDAETGLLYYTHRYYDAANGRWLSRDPIEEEGGINLYGMVKNNSVNRWDYLGQWEGSGMAPPSIMFEEITEVIGRPMHADSDVFAVCNCTSEKIEEAEKKLRAEYRKVRAQLIGNGVSNSSGNSCRQCAEEVLNILEVPQCFQCVAEHRYAESFGWRWLNQFRGHGWGSHATVICTAYDLNGKAVKALGFDYFSSPDSDDPMTEDQFRDFSFTWPDSPEAEHVKGLGVDF